MSKILLIQFVLLLIVGLSDLEVAGQKKRQLVPDPRISIKADRQPLGLVFRELMERYQIDIGFEQSSLDQGKWYFSFDTNMPSKGTHISVSEGSSLKIETTGESGFSAGPYPITIDIKDGSVKDIFDVIVPQMGNYGWRMSEGVVNIFPKSARDPRFAELLKIKVKSFELAKGSKVEDIITTLLDLPEFFDFRRKHQFTFSPIREGINAVIKAQYGRTIDQKMEFKNIQFVDLLNRLTKIKKGGWILKVRGKTDQGGDLGDLDI